MKIGTKKPGGKSAPKISEPRRVPIGTLKPDPKNARVHNPKNLDAIRASLAAFGQVEPLVVQAGTGKVIGGNGRLEVLRQSGVKEVLIVEVSLGEKEAAALSLALNRTAELAEWNESSLLSLLRSIPEDALLTTGFDAADLTTLLARTGEALDASPEELWAGMPECVNEDKKSIRSMIVHFATEEDVDKFRKLVKQNFSEKAKAIWYPEVKRADFTTQRYLG